MLCNELEAVLVQHGLSPLPAEAREHLADCPDCQDLLADFSAIAVAAKCIPAEVDPPERIWISLRAQLEAEGLIRVPQPAVVPHAVPWWNRFAQSFRLRTLASVCAGLFLVLGSVYFVERPGIRDSAKPPQPSAAQVSEPPKSTAPAPMKANPMPTRNTPPLVQSARAARPPQPRESTTILKSSPSETAYLGDSAAVLTQTEDALPSRELADNATVDTSLRQNLRTLNEFIAECEARLKQNPRDQLTREYLNMAYQQKAELLAAMMDTGRSEN